MKKTTRLQVTFREHPVGSLSLTPDNRLCVFEYDKKTVMMWSKCIVG